MSPLEAESCELQGDGILRPTAQSISAAISRAITARAGLLFVHSHPDPAFPLGLSAIDREAFNALASTLAPMLDGPFGAVVVHPHGWSGVLWTGGTLQPIERILRVGRNLQFLSPVAVTPNSPLDTRQQDALGDVHNRLRILTVAVVGCGGLGSPMAEQLTRMGVGELILVDHDRLDTPSNVRRVFGSRMTDLREDPSPPKVEVVGNHLDRIGLGVPIRRVLGDVRTEAVFRTLLDADIVLCGTDTHGSRAVLNDLASAYLLPVIDVGVRVGTKTGGVLTGLLAEVRVLTPTTPCLWCRRIISGDVIRAENLPDTERAQLKREGYVLGGVGDPAPSVIALTVLGSGLATCALLAILAEEEEVTSHGYWVDGLIGDARVTLPNEPVPSCRCRSILALGDSASVPLT
jgi:molybdopterin/thiamine biosynthesis adenylyltransferase